MFAFYLSLMVLLLSAVVSSALDRHIVPCDALTKSCECRETADECEFTLKIEELQTFVAYKVEAVTFNSVSQNIRKEDGTPYYINTTGNLVPSFASDDSNCNIHNEDFTSAKCTVPLTVDGKTYRPCIAVNGQIPGPTLVVYEGQVVVANVVNNLLIETTSIHWHGMQQRNTPWMDGAILISQCPIGPSETFRYYFRAEPTGSFWYHSHKVTQRADGLFGALIVQESSSRRNELVNSLNVPFIIDNPGNQTINLHEWSIQTNLDLYTLLRGDIGFFPGKPEGEIPIPVSDQLDMGVAIPYTTLKEAFGPDGLSVSDIPFYSGLINGKGRNIDVPYTQTRLEIFTVENGNVYRFRLIGAQSVYAYKFSIDEHNLTVMSTDGSLIEPVDAQFVILHTGERYDFLLKASKPRENVNDYWIRAETLAVNLTSGLPYPSLGQVAEAILHYGPSSAPKSTSYNSIKETSIPFDVTRCGQIGGCVAVNCPFQDYHSSYNTRCVNIDALRMLFDVPADQVPSGTLDSSCKDCELFFNIGSDTDNINGRNMVLPPSPLQTQIDDIDSSIFCNITKPCSGEDCACVHVREVTKFNTTIRIVLSSVGNEVAEGGGFSHPMHLHGHHFQVVEVGYGTYFPSNGTLEARNTDVICGDNSCSSPRWSTSSRSFSVNSKTLLKDTVIVPGGGYVVVEIISDNPGFWFMHCHIIPDLLDGMAVVINEVESLQKSAPDGFPTCGDFLISQNQFYENQGKQNIGNGLQYSLCVLCLSLLWYLLYSF